MEEVSIKYRSTELHKFVSLFVEGVACMIMIRMQLIVFLIRGVLCSSYVKM